MLAGALSLAPSSSTPTIRLVIGPSGPSPSLGEHELGHRSIRQLTLPAQSIAGWCVVIFPSRHADHRLLRRSGRRPAGVDAVIPLVYDELKNWQAT